MKAFSEQKDDLPPNEEILLVNQVKDSCIQLDPKLDLVL